MPRVNKKSGPGIPGKPRPKKGPYGPSLGVGPKGSKDPHGGRWPRGGGPIR